MLFPLPCSSGNLGRVYIKRWTPRFVEWSRRDGFLALVPRERPTLVLPCGHASYRVSIPMPKSDQSLLSSSLTHLGATLGSPALFLFPGWSPEMGAFSKCTVVGKHCFFPCLRGSGTRGPREEEQGRPGASSVRSAAALRALVLSPFQLCPAHSCLGEFIHTVSGISMLTNANLNL